MLLGRSRFNDGWMRAYAERGGGQGGGGVSRLAVGVSAAPRLVEHDLWRLYATETDDADAGNAAAVGDGGDDSRRPEGPTPAVAATIERGEVWGPAARFVSPHARPARNPSSR